MSASCGPTTLPTILLATYTTAGLTTGAVETMSISRAAPDIAYIIASGASGEEVTLDNLHYTAPSEPFEITDAEGIYQFTDVPPGEHFVAEVERAGWIKTTPIGPANVVVVGPGQDVTNVDFGNQVAVALAGDYNHDGFVNAADYILFRMGMGTSMGQADYDEWTGNFGQSSAAAAGSAAATLEVEPQPFAAFSTASREPNVSATVEAPTLASSRQANGSRLATNRMLAESRGQRQDAALMAWLSQASDRDEASSTMMDEACDAAARTGDSYHRSFDLALAALGELSRVNRGAQLVGQRHFEQ